MTSAELEYLQRAGMMATVAAVALVAGSHGRDSR